jgi:hypothetical protein
VDGEALPLKGHNIGHVLVDPPTLDVQVQIQRLVTEAFAKANGLQQVCYENTSPCEVGQPLGTEGAHGDAQQNDVDHGGVQQNEIDIKILMEVLFAKVATLLYERSSCNMLLTMLLLLNLSTMHGNTNTFMDELFSLLQNMLLLKNNKLPTTSYEAYKIIKSLGLTYTSIHVCKNGCVFFRNIYEHVDVVLNAKLIGLLMGQLQSHEKCCVIFL